MTKNVFISAGEVSGDIHAYHLCHEILKIKKDISFHGFGSQKMQSIGVNVLNDISLYSGVGLIENIPAAYKSGFNYKTAKEFFKKNKVELVILIDNQGFNLKLASLAKKNNIPVVYYIGPQEWIWGFKNGIHKTMKNVDTLYTIFQNEYEFYLQYDKYKHKVKYFGHPLLNIILNKNLKVNNKLNSHMTNDTKKKIALMPGSRRQELINTIPVFLEVFNTLKNKYDFIFIIPEIWENFIKQNFHLDNIEIYYGNSEKNMRLCDLIVASSGTVTLEAVILDIPIIPCYKLNKLSYLIAKLLIKPEFVTLPNLVAQKKVINEFLQDDFNSENIINEINNIFLNNEYYNSIKNDFAEIRKKLEPFDSIENTAKDIISNYL